MPETNNLVSGPVKCLDEEFKIAVLKKFNRLQKNTEKQFSTLTKRTVRWKQFLKIKQFRRSITVGVDRCITRESGSKGLDALIVTKDFKISTE